MNPPGGDAGEYSSKDCTNDVLRRTHATFGKCERLAYVLSTNYFRRTDENLLFSNFLAAKIIANFGDYFLPQKSLKMRDVLEKMRECGKLQNLRDFPHDCGMVDTYGKQRNSLILSVWQWKSGGPTGGSRIMLARTLGDCTDVIVKLNHQ